MVHVVFRLESHEWDLMADGARDSTARLASSDACEMWAVKPCFAAMLVGCSVVCVVCVLFYWILLNLSERCTNYLVSRCR